MHQVKTGKVFLQQRAALLSPVGVCRGPVFDLMQFCRHHSVSSAFKQTFEPSAKSTAELPEPGSISTAPQSRSAAFSAGEEKS